MEVLFVLIPVSIVLATASVVACLAAIRNGQYDDLESPRWRMLFDDRRPPAVPAGKRSGRGLSEDPGDPRNTRSKEKVSKHDEA